MSGCEDVRLDLGGYVLGGLEAEDRAHVEQHTAACGRCRGELDELAETSELLGALRAPAPPAPTALRERVLARRPRSRHRMRLLLAGTAVVAALAGVGVTSLLSGPPAPDVVVGLDAAEAAGVAGTAGLRQVANGVRMDLELTGLRPAAEGYYHAWLQRGELRVSAGTFVGSDAAARIQLLCGGRLEDYDRLTITWHAAGGRDEVVAVDTELAAAP